MLANRKKLNAEYWENRPIEPRTCKRCHKTVRERKMRHHCLDCRAIIEKPVEKKKCKTCDNILQRVSLTFCAECREVNRVTAYKKQSGARKEHALAIKHGLITKPTEDGGVNPQFLTRGKIRYDGYITL